MTRNTNQREGGDFTPISEILPGFEHLAPPQHVPVPKALTPQGKHHYTTAKQLDGLLGIAEDPNPDIGFMTRLLTLCSLPRTDPGNRTQYKRENGPYRLYLMAGPETKLPYGNIPRLLLAWISTEAVRTQSRELVLGKSLLAFMHQLGIHSNSGGKGGVRTRLRNQMDRLFAARVDLIYETAGYKAETSSPVSDRRELWWSYRQPEQDTLWESRIRLGEDFFNEIIKHPIPLDMRILREMRRSSLGLDIYMWLSYKTYSLYAKNKKPERLSWQRLYRQFGADPEMADDHTVVQNFRKDAIRELVKLKVCWPTLSYSTPQGCLEVRPCQPSVNPKALGTGG